MSEKFNNYRIDLLTQRLRSAISCTGNGVDASNSRYRCMPFNPGPSLKVHDLGNSVMTIVFNRLLSCAPQEVIDQMLDEVDQAVVRQGVFEMSNARKELVREAAFKPIERVKKEGPPAAGVDALVGHAVNEPSFATA